jgi:putative transposase
VWPRGGRPRQHSIREIIKGIRYVLRYGIPWDAMPKDLPPHRIVYDYYRALAGGGQLEHINHLLLMTAREKAGRDASPTAVILDSQTVKCDAPQGQRAYDGAKGLVGRKRHVAVDTGGRVVAALVTAGDVTDQQGGILLAEKVCRLCPWVQTVIVDGGYKEGFRRYVEDTLGRKVEVVKRPNRAKSFVVLPKRWKVEQTFGILSISRRMKIDYETLIACSTSFLLLASIFRMITAIARA